MTIIMISKQTSFGDGAHSSAASAKSHSRNVVIFGIIEVVLGQTIQYILDSFKDRSNGFASRPLMRSQAARAVRASATPWPSTAASISMLGFWPKRTFGKPASQLSAKPRNS
jgi:hypothetical protein